MKKIIYFTTLTLIFLYAIKVDCQWIQTNGISRGSISSFTTNNDKIFAATDFYGVYFTTNNGITWKQTSLNDRGVVSLASSGDNIFAASDGVYLSTDNGNTWNQVGLSNIDIGTLEISGNNIFAGADNYPIGTGGIYLSTNNGFNWSQIALNSHSVNTIVASGTTIYAGTQESGIFVSTNNGLNWVQTSLNNKFINTIAVNNNNVFAGTDSTIYRSTNSGLNWSQTSFPYNNVLALGILGNIVFAGINNYSNYSNSGIYISTNNGISWTQSILFNKIIFSIKVIGSKIFVGTRDENGVNIYLSTNSGNSWSAVGLNNQVILSLANNNNYIFAGTTYDNSGIGGLYRSSDNGLNWYPISYELSSHDVKALMSFGNNIFASASGKIYLSTNNGNSFSTKLTINCSIVCFANNGNILYAGANGNTGRGIYISTNSGNNWMQTGSNLSVISLACISNYIFAGVYSGGVYFSTNNGVNWIQTSLNNSNVTSLTAAGNYLYAASSNGTVRFSTNYGTNWINTNLNKYVYIFTSYSNNIFAGTDSGIFVSTNNGSEWVQRNEGYIDSPSIISLLISNNIIFSGTDQFSVWRRPLSEIIGIQPISTETPKQFSLSQNYPNPFNPTTQIEFSIPKNNEFVKLAIFDVTGREVSKLVNQGLDAGTYRVDFNGANLASGIYFYKLEAGEFVETRKMILIK